MLQHIRYYHGCFDISICTALPFRHASIFFETILLFDFLFASGLIKVVTVKEDSRVIGSYIIVSEHFLNDRKELFHIGHEANVLNIPDVIVELFPPGPGLAVRRRDPETGKSGTYEVPLRMSRIVQFQIFDQ